MINIFYKNFCDLFVNLNFQQNSGFCLKFNGDVDVVCYFGQEYLEKNSYENLDRSLDNQIWGILKRV